LTAATSTENRIKYALYHEDWNYGDDTPRRLLEEASRVLVLDYAPHMDGKLFCPVCTTNLTRTPKEKSVFSNGRRACFAHLPSYVDVKCDLRSKKPEGRNYNSEEEARQAIEHRELVVIHSFLESPPDIAGLESGTYDQSQVEDQNGPETEVPIARHHGQQFTVPTRISTIAALCRNFDANLYKYYVFPKSNAAVRLIDALIDVESVEKTDDTPRLYFGRILSTRNAGINPKPTNLRLTWFKHHQEVKDLCLKDKDATQLSKGINDESRDRVVIFWGKITESGIGLCINKPGWGEYALLPSKYNDYLP
jgi:hypothetical protein